MATSTENSNLFDNGGKRAQTNVELSQFLSEGRTMSKYAVCVGINDYPGTGNDLGGCVNDANDWESALKKRGFATTKLLDKAATKKAISAALVKTIAKAKSGDL